MFNQQSANVHYNAPLDAPRQDPIIRCRGRKLANSLHLGQRAMNWGEDAVPHYSVFLSPSIVDPIKGYDWIDDLTDEVTLALLVFTPGLENLSLLRLKFKFGESGRVTSSFVLKTHSSFRNRPDFNFWLGLNIAFLCVATCRFVLCCRNRWKESWLVDSKNLRWFDVILAFVFMVYSAGSFVRRLFICSLLDEVQPLLESFYAVSDISDATQVEQTQKKYFGILCNIMERVEQEELLKMMAYILIIVSIIRLIVYMSVHPRIALLSHTVVTASDNIFHFSVVFTFISFLLAWLACWSFGPDKDVFSTLPYAMLTELKMVMGEFPFGDPWSETFLEKVWYVCYAVLIFFLAVNIFLAIIVEAFVLVKRRLADEVLVERSILVDFVGLVRYRLLGPSLNWPSRLEVAQHLHTNRHMKGWMTSKELKYSKYLNFRSSREAQQYMDFYYGLLGEDVLAKPGRDFLKLKQEQKDTHRCLVVLFNFSEEQMERSARRVQEAWQDYVTHVRQVHSAPQGYQMRRPPRPLLNRMSRKKAAASDALDLACSFAIINIFSGERASKPGHAAEKWIRNFAAFAHRHGLSKQGQKLVEELVGNTVSREELRRAFCTEASPARSALKAASKSTLSFYGENVSVAESAEDGSPGRRLPTLLACGGGMLPATAEGGSLSPCMTAHRVRPSAAGLS